ncbi:MAG TPA: rod-binding protein [Bryobacteraceae bacterium]|nr:rod-binding protein [Bryobacteraceae bacterium]
MRTDLISGMTPAIEPCSKVEGAAKQFEALLIAQMLRGVREENEYENSTGSAMQDVADQQFAQVLANNGGLGLAGLVVKGLDPGAVPR